MTKAMKYEGLLERLSINVIATLMSTVIILLLMAVNGDEKLRFLEKAVMCEETHIQEERISVEESIRRYIDSLPISEPLIIEETEEIVAVDTKEVAKTVIVQEVTIRTSTNAEDEIYLLGKAIHGEASICDTEEKYKVGTVIMNRVASSKYPNTVYGVLSQPHQYSCYQDSRWYTEEPSKEELEIARDIYLNGVRVYGPEVIYQSKTCDGKCVDKTPWHEYGTD